MRLGTALESRGISTQSPPPFNASPGSRLAGVGFSPGDSPSGSPEPGAGPHTSPSPGGDAATRGLDLGAAASPPPRPRSEPPAAAAAAEAANAEESVAMHTAWEQLTDALPTGQGGRLGQVDVEHISPESLLGSGLFAASDALQLYDALLSAGPGFQTVVRGVCRRAELGGDGGEGRGGGTLRPPSPMTSPVKANGVDFDPKADGLDFSPIRPGFVDHSPGGNTSVLRVSHSPMAHSPLAGGGRLSGGGSGASRVNPAASFLSATFRVFSLLLDEEMHGAFNSDARYVAYVANEKNNEGERRRGLSVSKSRGDERRNDRGVAELAAVGAAAANERADQAERRLAEVEAEARERIAEAEAEAHARITAAEEAAAAAEDSAVEATQLAEEEYQLREEMERVGPRRCCSPRHRVPFDSRIEGSNCVSIIDDAAGDIWPALVAGAPPPAPAARGGRRSTRSTLW